MASTPEGVVIGTPRMKRMASVTPGWFPDSPHAARRRSALSSALSGKKGSSATTQEALSFG